jgi:hypothetical protein
MSLPVQFVLGVAISRSTGMLIGHRGVCKQNVASRAHALPPPAVISMSNPDHSLGLQCSTPLQERLPV